MCDRMVTSMTIIFGIVTFIISCLVLVSCIALKEYMNQHDTDLAKFTDKQIKDEFLQRYKDGKIK